MIGHLASLVLTVRDLAATRRFYGHGLGLREEVSADGRTALLFGQQKLNLREPDGNLVEVSDYGQDGDERRGKVAGDAGPVAAGTAKRPD